MGSRLSIPIPTVETMAGTFLSTVAGTMIPLGGRWNSWDLPPRSNAAQSKPVQSQGTMRLFVFLTFVLAAVAQDARELFQKHCSVCHGDGHGTERGPNLADSRRLRAHSVDELRAIIRAGVPARGMPAFNLPPAELDSLT